MISIEKIILDISYNYYNYLLSLENVNGIGMGYKIINGINTNKICLNVFVDEKVDKKFLSKNNIIPKSYMGIETDVIRTGKPLIKSNDEISRKLRPLEGGLSISVGDLEGEGTIACIVYKKTIFSKQYFILSNNHVLAKFNTLSLGTTILQPSESLGGVFPRDIVANLATFVPIKFSNEVSSPINYVDCAIAKLKNNSLASNKIFKIGKIAGTSKAELGLAVKKVGFATGLTEGKVTAIGVTTSISFGNKKSIYKNQFRADLFNLFGDSGSLILNNKNEAVGLLMAGPKDGSNVVFNDINLVLKYLNVELFM